MTETKIDPIRNLQIIVAALFLGAGTFLAVVAFLTTTADEMPNPGGLGKILLGVWAALVVGSLAVWPVVRNKQARLAVESMGAEAGDEGRSQALQHYSTTTIAGAALAEGCTLLAAAGAFATHHVGLLLAGVVGLVGIVLLFPSQTKFERFLEHGISHRNV